MNKTEEQWRARNMERRKLAEVTGVMPECEHPEDWRMDNGECGYCGNTWFAAGVLTSVLMDEYALLLEQGRRSDLRPSAYIGALVATLRTAAKAAGMGMPELLALVESTKSMG